MAGRLREWLSSRYVRFRNFTINMGRAIRARLFAWQDGEPQDSNMRRLAVRIGLYWALGYLIIVPIFGNAPLDGYSVLQSAVGSILVGAGLLGFVQIVLLMPFRDGSAWTGDTPFVVDARRLLFDSLVSSLFVIVAFSVIYQSTGLVFSGSTVWPSAIDALYFSAVTFSTLGYGDFSPVPAARPVAAFQALIGNLHLGMVVGSTFAALRR